MRRPRRQRCPKPIKVKVPKPKASELRKIYSGIVSGSTTQRILALMDALDWFDKAIPVFIVKSPLSSSEQQTLEKATKAKKLGLGSTVEGERESAFRRAVILYEKIWASKYKLPKLEDFYKKYDSRKAKLDKQVDALGKYGDITKLLSDAFSSFGVTFEVVKTGPDKAFDGVGKMLLNSDYARFLRAKLKAEGLLSLVLGEVHTILRVASLERDADGEHTLNLTKMDELLPKMMESVLSFSKAVIQSIGRSKLLKSGIASVPTQSLGGVGAKAPRTPRAPGAGRTAAKDKVAGLYRPDGENGILWRFLSDEKSHTLQEIQKLINVTEKRASQLISKLQRHGLAGSRWQMEVKGPSVRMFDIAPDVSR